MTKHSSPASLLTERSKLIARIAEIDAILRDRHGIEIASKIRKSRPQRAALVAALADGPKDAAAIAAVTGQTIHAVAQMAHKLLVEGAVERTARGVYALPAKKGKR